MLETQQFSQSFLQKLMQPQDEMRRPARNSPKVSTKTKVTLAGMNSQKKR